MDYRTLFQQIMGDGQFDRMPVIHWAGWDETHERWHQEGYPVGCDGCEFFDAVPFFTRIEANLEPFPPFEEETLEETDDYRIF